MDPTKPYLNRPPPPPPPQSYSFPPPTPNFSLPPPGLPPRAPLLIPKYPASSNYHYNPAPPPPPPTEVYKKKPTWAAPSKSIFSKIAELSKEEKTFSNESSSRRTYDEPASSAAPSYTEKARRDDRERYYSKSVDRENAPTYQSKRRAQSAVPEKYSQSSSSHSYNRRHYERPSDNSRERSSSKNSSSSDSKEKTESEREKLLAKWRKNYCETSEDIAKKLAELSYDEDEKKCWTRSSPADIFYKSLDNKLVEATSRLDALCSLFDNELIKRADVNRAKQKAYVPPPRKRPIRMCKHKTERCSSDSSSDSDLELEEDCSMEELSRKCQHPYRLHADLWHNDPGEMNDGPLCRCSARCRKNGIRHGIYPGEVGFPKCSDNSNNFDKLYHYRITISPPTNFLTKTPTIIKYDEHEFLFEGFSLFTHEPIEEVPTCKVIRFNIEYTILYVEEQMPTNFTIRELDLFYQYLFKELLELVDFSLKPSQADSEKCSCFHFLPRFVRDLTDNGKEVLAMCEVLRYLLDNSGPLVDNLTLQEMMNLSQHDWQNYVDGIKGMAVTNPGMKPCTVRVDQLDRNVSDLPECTPDEDGLLHPVIVHFGIRPPQLSYAGNPEYQKAWREYVKYRHLIANMSKPSFEDKRKLEAKENKLQEMRTQGKMKRNITVVITSKNFHRTGIMCDVIQHAMLLPVLTGHLRFHKSLEVLETSINYKFQNRSLLQLALTHPSYKENFGTNPDHARNSLTNCGIRQPEYGDRKIHYMNTRKRGINTLINIMSRFGKEYETDSNITHNERLEFLGDAVVEFLTSIHLFHMFPDLEEGGLATYRAAIVQNQHLALLARKLHLEEFMLYAHGSDLCHELELRHAMANCFEALMGALLLDGGIDKADKVFACALFKQDENLKMIWENYPPHPLQEQEPLGDRQWIESYEMLQNLTKFETAIGVQFTHIRLLARAFTDRSIGFTHLTLGSNQRLEFLGDTVLQLICSEFLYRHFPEHHEGHLSLLRSSLVNNRTQAVVCDDLGMTQHAVYSNPRAELKTKDRADLLESLLGALYVDKGLEYCQTFCHVCLFPRLQNFIMNQDWNDPKSKLQQCCLTLRSMDGGEPDIPIYKVIECTGPTNTRMYTVAVYFRANRLACSTGHSIQQAEMNAAQQALENSKELFPQLDHQKRIIAQSLKRQNPNPKKDQIYSNEEKATIAQKMRPETKLPKQYRPNSGSDSDQSNCSVRTTMTTTSTRQATTVSRKRKKLKKRRHSHKSPSRSKVEQSKPLHDVDDFSSISSDDDDILESTVEQSTVVSIVKSVDTYNAVVEADEFSSDLEPGEIV